MLKEIVCESILDAIAEIAMTSIVAESLTGTPIPESYSAVLLFMAQAYDQVSPSSLRGIEVIDEAMVSARNDVDKLLSTGHTLPDILKGL